jgi:hypothetical protein
MLSHFLTDLFEDVLKDRYPKFAYWLYYPEMTIALILAVLWIALPELIYGNGTILMETFFLAYAAFNWIGASNYGRRRALENDINWSPSWLDRSVAMFLQLVTATLGAGFLYLVYDSWSDPGYEKWSFIVLGLALLGYSIKGIFRLSTGGWLEWP